MFKYIMAYFCTECCQTPLKYVLIRSFNNMAKYFMLSLTGGKTQALIQNEHNYILKYAYKCTVKIWKEIQLDGNNCSNLGGGAMKFSSQFLFYLFIYLFLHFFPKLCSLNMLYYYTGKILFKKQSVGLRVGIENTDKNEFEKIIQRYYSAVFFLFLVSSQSQRSSYI